MEVARPVDAVADGAGLFWPPQAVRAIAAARMTSPWHAFMARHGIAVVASSLGLSGFWSRYCFVIIFDVVRAVDIASA
jgi:hypothetical protein